MRPFCSLLLSLGLVWSFTLEQGPTLLQSIVPAVASCGADVYTFEVSGQAADSFGNFYVAYRTNNPLGRNDPTPPETVSPGPVLLRPSVLGGPMMGYVILVKFDSNFTLLWQNWVESPGGNRDCGSGQGSRSSNLKVDTQGDVWLAVSSFDIQGPGFYYSQVNWTVANETAVLLQVADAHAVLMKFSATGRLLLFDHDSQGAQETVTPVLTLAPDSSGGLLAGWFYASGTTSWATLRMNAGGFECLGCPSGNEGCFCVVRYNPDLTVAAVKLLSVDQQDCYIVIKDIQWLGPSRWAISLYFSPSGGQPWDPYYNATLGGQRVHGPYPAGSFMGATHLVVDDTITITCMRTFWAHDCCRSLMLARGSVVMNGYWYGLYFYANGYIIDTDLATVYSAIQSTNWAGDFLLLKMDTSCNVIWHRTNVGGTLSDFAWDLTGDPRSGYLYASVGTDSNGIGALQFLGADTTFGITPVAGIGSISTWSLAKNAMTVVAAFQSSDGLLAGADYMQGRPAQRYDTVARVRTMAVLADGRLCVGGLANGSLGFRNTSLSWPVPGFTKPGFLFCYPAASPMPPPPSGTSQPSSSTAASPQTDTAISQPVPASQTVASTQPPATAPSNPAQIIVTSSQFVTYLNLDITALVLTTGSSLNVNTLIVSGDVVLTLDWDLSSVDDGLLVELISFDTLSGEFGAITINLATQSSCYDVQPQMEGNKLFALFTVASTCSFANAGRRAPWLV